MDGEQHLCGQAAIVGLASAAIMCRSLSRRYISPVRTIDSAIRRLDGGATHSTLQQIT
jgi:hypothetical protein